MRSDQDKRRQHGSRYSTGPKTLKAAAESHRVSPEQAARTYRRKYPKIADWWNKLAGKA